MLAHELLALMIISKNRKQSILETILEGIKQRHVGDKVPRCLSCGICMPTTKQRAFDSIYSELCSFCGKRDI